MEDQQGSAVPAWVPENAQRYLEHTGAGRSIRDLARAAGCHASTILRQIRRVESLRDDPLVDAALDALGLAHFMHASAPDIAVPRQKDSNSMTSGSLTENVPDDATLELEAARILRRLCETGAVLAVAEDMEKAVVVRSAANTPDARTAVVDTTIAQALALKSWISCNTPGRISRYVITAAGRSALNRIMAKQENHARAQSESGFAEDQSAFAAQRRELGEDTQHSQAGARSSRPRYNMAESPLTALARRKDKDGNPFLEDALVRAGERLREDFEVAQMGPKVAQNWDSFLTGGARGGLVTDNSPCRGPEAARDRVARALSDLGPGLSDVALRCCCYLQGLEIVEKRMGWSARSGKIVLRIALQRLRRHYDDQAVPDRLVG